MKKIFMFMFAVAVVTLVWGSSARAGMDGPQKGRVGGELIFWFPTVNGDASFSGVNFLGVEIEGTNLDIDDVMGLDQDVMTVEIGLWINPLKRHRFSLYWFIDNRTGTRVLEQAVNIGGQRYDPNVEINSNIEFQRWRLLYELAIIRNDLGRLALGSGITYLDVIASISGIGFGFNESSGDRIQVPLPVMSVAGEIHIPFLKGLGVFAEGSGFGISYEKITVSLIDARGGINFKTRFVYAQAGYQIIKVSADAFDNLEVGYSLQGPFASLGAKF